VREPRCRPLTFERARIETCCAAYCLAAASGRPLTFERARIETMIVAQPTKDLSRRPLTFERARIETTPTTATSTRPRVARSLLSGRGLKLGIQ